MKFFVLLKLFLVLFSFGSSATFAFNKNGPPKFIYAVVKQSEGGVPLILLNPLEEWVENNRLSDSYTKKERDYIRPIIEEAKLCNLAESQYEPCRPEYLKKSLKVLEKYGIKNHKEFQKWAEKQI